MGNQIFYLKNQPDHFSVETCHDVITWIDWIGIDAIASPDLIVLIEQYYWES